MEETSEEEYVPQPDPDSDESWESVRPGGKGKGKQGKGKGCPAGRGRTRSRGEGSSSRSRAPSRAPGRRGRHRTGALREEDRVQVAEHRAATIADMQVGYSYLFKKNLLL